MTDGTDGTDEPMDGPVDESQPAAGNLREALMAIRAKRGVLTPAIVVEEAADPQHPLHHRFEWDDTEAAIKWRLSQASSLLRVKYKRDIGNERADLRAFWVTHGDGGAKSTYEPTEEVAQDPLQAELMLRQFRRDWQTFKRRYRHMHAFVVEIVEDLRDERGEAS